MHALEFLRPSRARSAPRPIYAVVGDDAYLRREVLHAVVSEASAAEDEEFAPARFAGDSVGLVDVLDELRTLPFFSDRRVVIVDGADTFVTANRKALEAYTEHPVSTGSLVLCVKTWPASTRLARQVAGAGLTIECKAPAESELSDWVERLAREQFDAKLDREAADLLVELVGPEAGLLASEVQKLAVYVGERRRIQAADVKRMVGAGRVEAIWEVLEQATTGHSGQALDLLDRLLTSGEHPVGLLAAMSASLRRVYHAGQLRRARRTLEEACQEAGIPTYRRQAIELVRKQHAHLGPARVDRLPADLLRADLDLKGFSQLPPRVVLERLLVNLASPRLD